jgi:hypothetical protein
MFGGVVGPGWRAARGGDPLRGVALRKKAADPGDGSEVFNAKERK